MYPSSKLCRAQASFQRERASASNLVNIRDLATKAATAWGKEAALAEGREQRALRSKLSAEDAEIALEFLNEDPLAADEDEPETL